MPCPVQRRRRRADSDLFGGVGDHQSKTDPGGVEIDSKFFSAAPLDRAGVSMIGFFACLPFLKKHLNTIIRLHCRPNSQYPHRGEALLLEA